MEYNVEINGLNVEATYTEENIKNIFINIILSVVIGGNPLPLGGGRSLVNSWPLTLAFDVLLYGS